MAVAPTTGFRAGAPEATAAFGGTSAEAKGASLGEAMARFGVALHEDDLEDKELEFRRRRDAEAARAGAELARLEAGMAEWRDDARLNRRDANGEATGHTAAWQQEYDQRAAALLGTIENEQVGASLATRIAEMRGRGAESERSWEQGQRGRAQATNSEDANNVRATTLATSPFNMAQLDAAVADMNADLTLQTSIAPEVRDHARRQFSRQLALAAVDAAIEQNPAATLTLLQGGTFNRYGLTADDVRTRVDTAQAEVNAADARARAALSAAQSEVRERVRLFNARLRAGEVPSDAEFEEITTAAQSAQLPVEAYNGTVARVQAEINRSYGPRSGRQPLEIRAALDQLDARIGAAGANPDTADLVRRSQLQTLLTAATQRQQSDPLGAFAQRGGRVSPVNPADPRSIDARIVAMRASGGDQFFNEQEAAVLQQQARSGPSGRLEAVNLVAAIGGRDPSAGEAAARQIAANDRVFRHAARLNPFARARVLAGAEARRQMPQQLDMPDGSHDSFDAVSQRWFQANIAPQLRRHHPEYANDVLEAARSYYAEGARQQGNLASKNFDEGAFGEAVSAVLGQTTRGGGTGYWDFGRDGQVLHAWNRARRPGLILPTRMTQERFDQVMTWLPIARLGEREWPRGSAPNGAPRWRNGSAVSVDDIRGRYVPEMVDDGVYEFRAADGSGGMLGATGGGNFRLDVYALEAHGAPRRAGAPPDPALRGAIAGGASEYDRRRRQAGGN